MTTSPLPEAEAKILAGIRKKYEAGFEELALRGKKIRLLQVTDLEPFLAGRDVFKEVEKFPFWIRLWEAALVLADVMAALPHSPGETLLELGAGLAAPGLAAAASGYRVTVSDYEEEILAFPKVSAAANGFADMQFVRLDWCAPPTLPRFGTVIGAEILFRDSLFEPLLKVFDLTLAPGGTIYLAHDVRRKSLPKFLTLAEKTYEIAVSTRTVTTDGQKLTVIVNRLRRRCHGAITSPPS